MPSRIIAIAASVAALAFAATPVAAVAATAHHPASAASTDRSHDVRGARHVDPSPDRSSIDRSADSQADRLDG
jgi:hypothetical protein